MVAYENLIARHGPLVAATWFEDIDYVAEYGQKHPAYFMATTIRRTAIASDSSLSTPSCPVVWIATTFWRS
eukprot:4662907-Prymnesium_polylepis.1